MLLFSSVVVQGPLAFHLFIDALKVLVVLGREPLYGGWGGRLTVSAGEKDWWESSKPQVSFLVYYGCFHFQNGVTWLFFIFKKELLACFFFVVVLFLICYLYIPVVDRVRTQDDKK